MIIKSGIKEVARGGVDVVSLDEVSEKDGSFDILIICYYVSSVMKKIETNGFSINRVFFWGELLIPDIEMSFFEQNQMKLREAYNSLNDYLSKMIFKNMVSAPFTKNVDLFSRTCEKEQYFPEDIFTLHEEEVFVDAGAFDGDTIEKFLIYSKQKYKYIYAFEPDNTNYARLLERNYRKNIKIYNAGLYGETREISFSADKGGSSKIESEGSNIINVLRFDDLELQEKNITFVKMDIEGSELSALKGMEKTIKRCKPKLAICIYHKFEDLWELPLYIKSLVPEYRFYIRNYTTHLDEIVLYAVL